MKKSLCCWHNLKLWPTRIPSVTCRLNMPNSSHLDRTEAVRGKSVLPMAMLIPEIPHFANELPLLGIPPIFFVARRTEWCSIVLGVWPPLSPWDYVMDLNRQVVAHATTEMCPLFNSLLQGFWERHSMPLHIAVM